MKKVMKHKIPLLPFYFSLIVVAVFCQGYLCTTGSWTASLNTDFPILQHTVLSVEHDLVSYAIDWVGLLADHLF